MRFFNTEGPMRPAEHYAIDPLSRVDVDELLDLVRRKRYFVLHAPRQTSKTSALIALRDRLNSREVGNCRCVNINVEVAQVARDDVAAARETANWPGRPWCHMHERARDIRSPSQAVSFAKWAAGVAWRKATGS